MFTCSCCDEELPEEVKVPTNQLKGDEDLCERCSMRNYIRCQRCYLKVHGGDAGIRMGQNVCHDCLAPPSGIIQLS